MKKMYENQYFDSVGQWESIWSFFVLSGYF